MTDSSARMSDEGVPHYSLDDDLEEAAERASRELPSQIARVRAHLAETRRKLTFGHADEEEGETSGA